MKKCRYVSGVMVMGIKYNIKETKTNPVGTTERRNVIFYSLSCYAFLGTLCLDHIIIYN